MAVSSWYRKRYRIAIFFKVSTYQSWKFQYRDNRNRNYKNVPLVQKPQWTLSHTFSLSLAHIHTLTFLLCVWAPPPTAGAESMNIYSVSLRISHGPHYLCLRYSKKLHLRQSAWSLSTVRSLMSDWMTLTVGRFDWYILVFNCCVCVKTTSVCRIKSNQPLSTNFSPAVMLMKVWTGRMFMYLCVSVGPGESWHRGPVSSEQWGGIRGRKISLFLLFSKRDESKEKGQLKWGKRVGRATHTVREKYSPLICQIISVHCLP